MVRPNELVQALLDCDFNSAETLLANGAEINCGYDSNGWTALHFMVENMLVESAKWLLDRGADPNQKDASGWTPLLLAIDAEGNNGTREFVERGIFPPAAELTRLFWSMAQTQMPKVTTGGVHWRLRSATSTLKQLIC